MWRARASTPDERATAFASMMEAMRILQDRVAGADAPPTLVAEAARLITGIAEELGGHEVPESHQLFGRLAALPGLGQCLVPPIDLETVERDRVVGHLVYGRFHLGWNGAAHGGAIPLVFDDVMGRFVSDTEQGIARTAYLKVDFRSITPVGKRLRIEARLAREEGRKRFVSATLHDGETLCAEAEALFVRLRPQQS